MPILEGRRGLILGVANQRSLAWGIAQACAREGAKLALTYQNEVTGRRVKTLCEEEDIGFALACDVNRADALAHVFDVIGTKWGRLDFVVHAVGFADPAELRGRYVDTTEGNFVRTMLTSVYSFTDVARRSEPLMHAGGSLLTLSYYGASKVIPNYNVMGLAKASLEASVRYLAADLGPCGIRVNTLSAGPVKTVSANAVRSFGKGLNYARDAAPLGRNVTQEDIGRSAVYLLSDYASGVTGETHFVDGGFNTMAMSEKAFDAHQDATRAETEKRVPQRAGSSLHIVEPSVQAQAQGVACQRADSAATPRYAWPGTPSTATAR